MASVDLRKVAAECLEAASGDSREAATALEERAKADAALYEAMLDPYLSKAAWEAVRRACQAERRTVWTPPKHGGRSDSDNAQSLAKSNAESLLDFRLPLEGMPRIADADGAMLRDAARFYTTQAADMSFKARWLARIENELPKGKTVGGAMDNARLRALQAEVQDAA